MIGAGARPNSGPYRSTRPFGGGTTLLDVTLTSGLPPRGTRPEGVGVRRHGRARPYHDCYSATREDLDFPSLCFVPRRHNFYSNIDSFIYCRVILFHCRSTLLLTCSVNQNKPCIFVHLCLPSTDNHPHFPLPLFPPTLQNLLRRPCCHISPLPLIARGLKKPSRNNNIYEIARNSFSLRNFYATLPGEEPNDRRTHTLRKLTCTFGRSVRHQAGRCPAL